MYKIYAFINGTKTLLYQPGNKDDYLALSPKLTRELSKAGSLEFTLCNGHPLYNSLQKLVTIVTVEQDDEEIWRGRVLKSDRDFQNRKKIYCEGALAWLNDSCITPFTFTGKLSEFIDYLCKAHREFVEDEEKYFYLGKVEYDTPDDGSTPQEELKVHFGDSDEYGQGSEYGNIWDIVQEQIIDTFGGYIYWTREDGKNKLNYCSKALVESRCLSQPIEFGSNLLDFTENVDASKLYTRLYPLGAQHEVEYSVWDRYINGKENHTERYSIKTVNDGKYYIDNELGIQSFGIICKTKTFDDCEDEKTLLKAAKADLAQNYAASISYTIKAVDLKDAGYDVERLKFGWFAYIKSKYHFPEYPDYIAQGKVMVCYKMVEHLDNPAQTEYTFGMKRKTLVELSIANYGKVYQVDEMAQAAAQAVNRNYDASDANTKSVGNISSNIQNLVNSTGSEADTYEIDHIPTMSNEPFISWTDEEKLNHAGSIFYAKLEDGTVKAYRYLAYQLTDDSADVVDGNYYLYDPSFVYLPNYELSYNASTKTDKKHIISTINVSEENITIKADKVDLQGYVTFTNLEEKGGETVIDGSHIKTGTLTADALEAGALTADNIKAGSISFDNLAYGSIFELVWVNPNAGSQVEFAGQTINSTSSGWKTSRPSTEYSGFLVTCRDFHVDGSMYGGSSVIVLQDEYATAFGRDYGKTVKSTITMRNIKADSSGITFEEGYYFPLGDSYELGVKTYPATAYIHGKHNDNNCCIPQRIYGLKLGT